MRRPFATVAITTLLAISTGATAMAADLFSTFKSACLDTQGEIKNALAVVDAAGWKDMPIEAIPTDNMNFKLNDASARTTGDGSDQRVIVIGNGETTLAGRSVPAKICFIAGSGAQTAAAQSKSILAMEPAMTMNVPNAAVGAGPLSMTIYAFRETRDGRVAVPLAELSAPATPFVMVMVIGEQTPVGMLGRFAITP